MTDEEMRAKMLATQADASEASVTASKPPKPPERDRLLALRDGIELWHDVRQTAFASIKRTSDGVEHVEHVRVRSKAFKAWLVVEFMARNENRAPGATGIAEALNGFEGHALAGPQRETAIRVAERDGKVYLDLGRPAWDAIEIDGAGWRIVASAPVPFLRPSGLMPLPVPVRGGEIEELRPFVNVASDDDFKLLVAYAVAALSPSGPYPMLNPLGEGGTAKTTLTRVVRAVTDPNATPTTGAPKKEDDLIVCAVNQHVCAFDNLGHLDGDLADALCRLATGGGIGKREHYTDGDQFTLYACRPVILNGISDLALRDDVAQRTITLPLRDIAEEDRRTEKEFWRKFNEAAPRIFGCLLDAVSRGIRGRPAIEARIEAKELAVPRMADFCAFSLAALPAFGDGWDEKAFLAILRAHRERAAEKTAESNQVARALREIADQLWNEETGWKGTPGDLLKLLNAHVREADRDRRQWPVDTIRLGGRLRASAAALRVLGLDVQIGNVGRNKTTLVTIRLAGPAQGSLALSG